MSLTAYQTDLTRLLQNPSATTALYQTSDLTLWINKARGQLSGESESIRYRGTLTTVVGQAAYNFSSINTGVAATTGIQGAIHVRSLMYGVGTGNQWVTPRAWEWFELYNLNNPVPDSGPPTDWAQYGQGAAPPGTMGAGSTVGGSIYIDPPPDLGYILTLDCVCFPIALVDDSTVEAIPYLWTDAVPYLAAYYALLSSQMQARRADAEAYFNYYQTFLARARQSANPSVLRSQYEQSSDPAQLNKLGVQQSAGNG
jgi:hypothetical protein